MSLESDGASIVELCELTKQVHWMDEVVTYPEIRSTKRQRTPQFSPTDTWN